MRLSPAKPRQVSKQEDQQARRQASKKTSKQKDKQKDTKGQENQEDYRTNVRDVVRCCFRVGALGGVCSHHSLPGGFRMLVVVLCLRICQSVVEARHVFQHRRGVLVIFSSVVRHNCLCARHTLNGLPSYSFIRRLSLQVCCVFLLVVHHMLCIPTCRHTLHMPTYLGVCFALCVVVRHSFFGSFNPFRSPL